MREHSITVHDHTHVTTLRSLRDAVGRVKLTDGCGDLIEIIDIRNPHHHMIRLPI
jgi:hypothetical protein